MEGFKQILKEAKTFPKAILSDKESGIRSKYFTSFCKEHNIKIRHPKTFEHAPFVEAFNRSQKMLIYKYLTQFNTENYLEVSKSFLFLNYIIFFILFEFLIFNLGFTFSNENL